jgi:hypothetical protein
LIFILIITDSTFKFFHFPFNRPNRRECALVQGMVFFKREEGDSLSKQDVCLPPPAGCRKSDDLPLSIPITPVAQAARRP